MSAKIAAILDGIDGFEKDEVDEPRWTWHEQGSPSQRMSRSRQEGLTFGSEDQTGRTSLGDAERLLSDQKVVIRANYCGAQGSLRRQCQLCVRRRNSRIVERAPHNLECAAGLYFGTWKRVVC
jgi:hypothetical protein